MKKIIGPKPMIVPMPALLVGTYSSDGIPNAMTAAWTAVCCHQPPCVGVGIRRSRLTFKNLLQKKAFTLNVPDTALAEAVDYLGVVSGAAKPDKIAATRLDVERASKVDAPIIASCPINIECSLIDQMTLGSHSWFVGKVEACQVDERVLDNTGTLDPIALDPLIYVTSVSRYHALGKEVAKAFVAPGKRRPT